MPSACTCRNGLTCVLCYRAMLGMSGIPWQTIPAGQAPPWQTIPAGQVPPWHTRPTGAVPPAATSTQLQTRTQAVAHHLGGWQRFTVRRSDKAQVAAGFPDDLYLGHGRLLVIEYKNEQERVTLPQQDWLEAFWCHNALVEVVVGWPSDEAALVALLRGPAPTPRDRQWMMRLPRPCGCEEIP